MERIIINGFFGKGNCGDEAILQTWYDRLSDRFRIVASVDIDVANFCKPPDEVELYKKIDMIHNRRFDIFCREDIKYYIIGGGGLGLGFGVEQWLHAVLRRKKKFYLGTIVHDEFFETKDPSDSSLLEINSAFFKSFEMIAVRDRYSFENLKNIFGVDSIVIPDIAVSMSSEPIEIKSDRKYITVTIRHCGENDMEYLNKWVDKICDYAARNSYDIIYLPFDRTDEILMKSMNLDIRYEKIFWHPKNAKYIISKSEMAFSIGRFHPLIFAISSAVSFYYIDNPKSGKDKCYQLMEDYGLLDFHLTKKNLEDGIEFEKCSKIEEVSKRIVGESNDFFEKLNAML